MPRWCQAITRILGGTQSEVLLLGITSPGAKMHLPSSLKSLLGQMFSEDLRQGAGMGFGAGRVGARGLLSRCLPCSKDVPAVESPSLPLCFLHSLVHTGRQWAASLLRAALPGTAEARAPSFRAL